MKESISSRVNLAIQDKVFPGCVIGVVYKNGERLILPYGNFTYDIDSLLVKEDTLYDTASLTKSIPTASLALMLIDQGKLNILDRLIDHIPEFDNSDRETVLIKHLLTYTLDGYGLASLKQKTAGELFDTLLTHDFEKRPGTVFKYTNIPAALLGLVIERITGSTLDKLADEYFFIPLGMNRTTFYPERFPLEEIVPTEIDDWRGLVHGIVHDESAYICKKEGRIVGHAGVFSTAGDILNFMEMLLNEGTSGGRTYFSKEVVKLMGTNQIAELNDFTGLGWELNQPRFLGKYCTEHTFAKTGFTGTLCVCDVESEVAYVILSNRIYPKRSADSVTINSFRADLGEIILK